jgi:hypothetical protein
MALRVRRAKLYPVQLPAHAHAGAGARDTHAGAGAGARDIPAGGELEPE